MKIRRFFVASFIVGNALVAVCLAGCTSKSPENEIDAAADDVVQPPGEDGSTDSPIDSPQDSLTDKTEPPKDSSPDSPTDSLHDTSPDQADAPEDGTPVTDAPSDSPSDSPSDAPNDTAQDGGSKYGKVGTDDAFDIMTWNLKDFPISTDTVGKLTEIIPILKPDMIAVQEVEDANAFDELASKIPGWKAKVPVPNDPSVPNNPPVGMLWNSDTVVVDKDYAIFKRQFRPFPRTPIVFEVTWKNESFVVINVHYKAMGDDVIDKTNPYDEEMRRLEASELLETALQMDFKGKRVILLGDFNDRLEEPENTNIFQPFLDWPKAYLFTDMPIAQNPTDETMSYTKSPKSHLDHILITSELFEAYEREGAFTRTVPVDRLFFSSLSKYQKTISDHRPVFLHIPGN